jgi:hypothetical protein
MRLRNARRARAPHRFSAHLRRETSLGRVFPLCSDGLIKQAGRRLRTFIVASMVMTVFLTGCDPVGLRRISGFRPPGHQCLESEGVSPFEAPPEIRDGFPFAAGNDGRKMPVGGWSVIAGVTLATSVSGSSRHPEDSHGLHSRGGKVVSG